VKSFDRHTRYWTRHRYSARYRAFFHYSPVGKGWFFWSQKFGRFLPVSAIGIAPPSGGDPLGNDPKDFPNGLE
jgi:hypothetical protein